MGDSKEKIKVGFKDLQDKIVDLSQLNVNTFSGKLSAIPLKKGDGSLLNLEELINNAKTSGELTLRAATTIHIDGDSDFYVDETISKELMDAHIAAIEAGQKVRTAFASMVKDGILGLLPKGK